MSNYKIINSEVVNLYKKGTFKSEIVSQGLIWEKVEVLDVKNNWYKIKQYDDYVSYIYKDFLIDFTVCFDNKLDYNSKWYFVKDRLIFINSLENNIGQEFVENNKILSFGSLIPIVEEYDENNYITLMPNGNKYIVNADSLILLDDKKEFKDLIVLSMNNLGTPYFWGGKSGFGFDCSGFIQHLFRFYGVCLPRDCKDQVKSKYLICIKSDYQIGDLIYFYDSGLANHVGMFVNNHEFIHSSGCVKVNSINKDSCKYNKSLNDFEFKVFRLNSNA